MRLCSKCGETRPLEQFARRGDGHYPVCKSCKAEYNRQYRKTPAGRVQARRDEGKRTARRREWLWAEKSKPCERCGNTYHPVAMQFDHLPGFKKEFEVSLGVDKSIQAMAEERKKCQLLCANCHHIVTWERRTGNVVPL
jgi:hypothetical protein